MVTPTVHANHGGVKGGGDVKRLRHWMMDREVACLNPDLGTKIPTPPPLTNPTSP